MKLIRKGTLPLIVLPILFLALHFSIYVRDPVSPDWFILVSHDPEPLAIEAIELKEALYPGYLKPFQKFEYHYVERPGNEIVIIERGSMFKVDMDIIRGDPADYYDDEVDGMFYKGFGVDDYPNTLFFLLQYLIVTAFIVLAVKKVKRMSK